MHTTLDHVAIGVVDLKPAGEFLVDELAAEFLGAGPGPGYRMGQWRFSNGGRLELLEPNGDPDSFMKRFVEGPGPGIHHVTFKVPDLAIACDRVRAAGYEIVGYSDAKAAWREAFLHPKQAQGIVVQFAESRGDSGWRARWGPTKPSPVALVGLRMRASDAERARILWSQVCNGHEVETGRFCWRDSPIEIDVEIDSRGPEAPLAIAVASDRPLDLPQDPIPKLGARFLQAPARTPRS
jgi:catechol 2,3-dioxygenase-like lactoylglutathione lyase family enzyme